jgi:hypothetical protein
MTKRWPCILVAMLCTLLAFAARLAMLVVLVG